MSDSIAGAVTAASLRFGVEEEERARLLLSHLNTHTFVFQSIPSDCDFFKHCCNFPLLKLIYSLTYMLNIPLSGIFYTSKARRLFYVNCKSMTL